MNSDYPPNSIGPASQEPAPSAGSPFGVLLGSLPGGDFEVSPALIREWGPLLKPNGIGLLMALHSFEESTSSHPFFGWAHCTQNSLAAYLDSSQDTIARYTGLLVTCGLLHVDEVETSKGKQKLYRVTRGVPLPSISLLEYLIFDADGWTRKHLSWLLETFQAFEIDTELTRIIAVLKRAYTAKRDSKGLITLLAGERLTKPDSHLTRRTPNAVQANMLDVLTANKPSTRDSTASCGQVPEQQATEAHLRQDSSAPCGQVPPAEPKKPVNDGGKQAGGGDLSAWCGGVPPVEPNQPGDLSAPCGQDTPTAMFRGDLSAWCGQVTQPGQPQLVDLSASCGQVAVLEPVTVEDLSAPCGQVQSADGDIEDLSAPCGQVPDENAQQSNYSAPCGQVPDEKDAATEDSTAPCGQVPPQKEVEEGRLSAPCGQVPSKEEDLEGLSAPCGQVSHVHERERDNVNVNNVTRLTLKENENVNVNVSAGADETSEVDELLQWGTQVLGDNHSLEWHRRCIDRWGIETYRQAIATTQRALNGGKVANAGAYFTGVLRRLAPTAQATFAFVAPSQPAATPPAAETPRNTAPRSAAAPVPAIPPTSVAIAEREDNADADAALGATWQAASIGLRMAISAEEYNRTLRYAKLLELDRTSGWALLGLPNDYLCEQVRTRFAGLLRRELTQVCGTTVDVAVVVLPGQGRDADATPTLAEVLAGRASG